MSISEQDREILERIKEQERAERTAPADANMEAPGALVAFIGFCRFAAIIAVGFSLFQFYLALTNAYSAPQQTAGATLAIATAVIPFVLVQLLEGFKQQN